MRKKNAMKRKIMRLIQKMACFLFIFMYGIGWFMTYAFLAFLVFGDAIVGHEFITLAVSALAGGVSGGLLYMYILKS